MRLLDTFHMKEVSSNWSYKLTLYTLLTSKKMVLGFKIVLSPQNSKKTLLEDGYLASE